MWVGVVTPAPLTPALMLVLWLVVGSCPLPAALLRRGLVEWTPGLGLALDKTGRGWTA